MQVSPAAPLSERPSLRERGPKKLALWALLWSCGVHTVLLLQPFFVNPPPTAKNQAAGLIVRWIDPAPTPPTHEEAIQFTEEKPRLKPEIKSQEATKKRAKHNPQSAVPSDAVSTENIRPTTDTPIPQTNVGTGTVADSTTHSAPQPPTGAGMATHAGSASASITNPAPAQATQPAWLDLSPASLARAAKQANATSQAYQARRKVGLEPVPQAKVLAKSIASAAIPGCLSSSTDGEGQPLAGPSGSILHLPIVAYDAILGKCKIIR